jgi:hypothetical protein
MLLVLHGVWGWGNLLLLLSHCFAVAFVFFWMDGLPCYAMLCHAMPCYAMVYCVRPRAFPFGRSGWWEESLITTAAWALLAFSLLFPFLSFPFLSFFLGPSLQAR